VARTVLIVDDHAGFRSCARRAIEATDGFEVVGEADNGVAALQASSELHPDIVLLDVQLPDVDGFEVAARLTANGGGPAVVLTSTRDAADYGRLIGDSGARGFIPKGELSVETVQALLE
jgi:DNA-binding NarL/FixJ family response regulator